MTFEQWCDEVDRINVLMGGAEGLTASSTREDWRPAFEDGETPAEALRRLRMGRRQRRRCEVSLWMGCGSG